jgi:glucose-1-phosphate thymidylyltransferase
MKGIVLAGGSGSRLDPMTKVVSKQLLPIYDKPLIFYPISTLMLAGINEILIITTPHDINRFKNLLDHFSDLGVELSFIVQEKPEGIAQAFILAEDFIKDDDCMLILGDNLFFGHDLSILLRRAIKDNKGATIFGYRVSDPERYGVIEFNQSGDIKNIIEKPKAPPSSYAVTGIYIYSNEVISFAKTLKPSARGELEITDINKIFLSNNNLNTCIMGRGFTWLDTGTPNSLLEAGQFVQMLEKRQGLKVACPEEIAWRNGWIETSDMQKIATNSSGNYNEYLINIINEKTF